LETEAFWREQESRFVELAASPGASDLHAEPVDPAEVDLQAVLDGSSERTRAAITNSAVTPGDVYLLAKSAARAGRILLGERADRWIVSGGPEDAVSRATLQTRIKTEARMAADGKGLVDPAASDQEKLEAWLDLLLREGGRQFRELGGVKQLARASAEMCHQLAARAYVAKQNVAVPADRKKRQRRQRPPTDAARLKAERERIVLPLLVELDWTPTEWASHAGVSPSVTLGYLAGKSTPRKVQMQHLTAVLRRALKQLTLRLAD